MSYKQAMRWSKKHPKGTKQPVLMSTGSGFWPAKSWIDNCWLPYAAACESLAIEPCNMERFYHSTIGRNHYQRTPQDYAAMTKAGTLG